MPETPVLDRINEVIDEYRKLPHTTLEELRISRNDMEAIEEEIDPATIVKGTLGNLVRDGGLKIRGVPVTWSQRIPDGETERVVQDWGLLS